MRRAVIMAMGALLVISGCSIQGNNVPSAKVHLVLTDVDGRGLRGGGTAVSYEFCIPDILEKKTEVKSIDPTVEFACGSSGRVGCQQGQCLSIGNTFQENYRSVLQRLAVLPYIEAIVECFWE